MRWAVLALALTACAAPVPDAGCLTYGAARPSMPRPVGTGPLAEWVATLDDAMTGSCR